jgi:predicted ATPase
MELNFLADLASDRRFRHLPFVILGAYRDNEVGSEHKLEVALEYMKMNSVRLYTIDVLPFTGQEMRDLLYEIIGDYDDTIHGASAIAEILFEKSRGNLVFYLEVLPIGFCLSYLAFAIHEPKRRYTFQRENQRA